MAIVRVVQPNDEWWLEPDWEGQPERLMGMVKGPYKSEPEVDEAAARYLLGMAPNGVGEDPMGPPWHGRGSGETL